MSFGLQLEAAFVDQKKQEHKMKLEEEKRREKERMEEKKKMEQERILEVRNLLLDLMHISRSFIFLVIQLYIQSKVHN